MAERPAPAPPAPARRADAERNRSRILDVAREAFAGPDPGVSMAEISRRAGVGMATLYRNFPGRRELLEAVYLDDVAAICAAAASVEGATPGAAFLSWLDHFFAFSTGKHPIGMELLAEVEDGVPFMNANRARVLAAGRPLLVAAQASGEIRDDVGIEHVLDLVVTIGTVNGDAAHVRAILDIAFDGLRPR